jgi:pentatricopeptide repeat protein
MKRWIPPRRIDIRNHSFSVFLGVENARRPMNGARRFSCSSGRSAVQRFVTANTPVLLSRKRRIPCHNGSSKSYLAWSHDPFSYLRYCRCTTFRNFSEEVEEYPGNLDVELGLETDPLSLSNEAEKTIKTQEDIFQPMDTSIMERLYNDAHRLLYGLTVIQVHEPIRPELWLEAEQCIQSLSNARTVQSVDLTWKLIDAMIQNFIMRSSKEDVEDESLNSDDNEFGFGHARCLVKWDIWHSVLLNWQQVTKDSLDETSYHLISSKSIISPSDLLAQLDCWRAALRKALASPVAEGMDLTGDQKYIVFVNSKTFSILLDVVGNQAKFLTNKPNSVSGEILPLAELAEKLFFKMMDYSMANTVRSDKCFPPSTTNLNMVLILWARLSMIERAQLLLQYAITSSSVRPDLRSYNAVLHAHAMIGDGKNAERVLHELLRQQELEQEQYEKDRSTNSATEAPNIIQPSIHSWNTVLAAWTRSPDKEMAAKRVENLLSCMVAFSNGARITRDADHLITTMAGKSGVSSWREAVKPNLITLNTALAAWARVGEADTCARLLGEMRDLYKAGQLDDPPDVFSYATVMNAFAKAKQPEKAEALWVGMYQAYAEHGAEELRPNLTLLTTIMDAYSRQIAESVAKQNYELAFDGLLKAEKIFHSIHELQRLGHLDSGPDTAAYNVILKCYLYCGRAKVLPDKFDSTAESANSLLLEMKNLQASKESNVSPTFASYSIVIQSWLNRSDGVPRAIELLDEAWQKRSTGDPLMKPDHISVSSIITAFCQANQPRVAQKFLLSICEVRRRDPSNMIEPKIANFGIIFAALNRSKDPGVAHVAQNLVDQVDALYKLNVLRQGPDHQVYESLISIWANSSLPGAAKKAYAIYTDMRRRASEGDESMKPDIKTCHQVLFALSGKHPEPALAETMVRQMYDEYKNNLSTVRPDNRTFNYALTAWSRYNHPESIRRVDLLFKEMQRLHKEGDITCDVVTFNIVLHCLASTSRREGAEQAEALFVRMNELADSGQEAFRPNVVSYGCLINAWVRVLDLPRAEAVLVTMFREFQAGKTHLKPHSRHFEQVAKAWLSSNDPSKKNKSQSVLSLMRLVYPEMKAPAENTRDAISELVRKSF